MDFFSVPDLCKEGAGVVVCIGGGPSLTEKDVAFACERADAIIGINDAYRIAPRLDVLYGCDFQWWNWHPKAALLEGMLLLTSDHQVPPSYPGIGLLERIGDYGLAEKPWQLYTGHNGGYQAIQIGVHLGAKRIILLGYDQTEARGGRSHWFGNHPGRTGDPDKYVMQFRPAFQTLVGPLAERGIECVNATPGSHLTVFPMIDLEEALCASS